MSQGSYKRSSSLQLTFLSLYLNKPADLSLTFKSPQPHPVTLSTAGLLDLCPRCCSVLTFAAFPVGGELVVVSAAALEVGLGQLHTLLLTSAIVDRTRNHS